jgi:hypothetical protein
MRFEIGDLNFFVIASASRSLPTGRQAIPPLAIKTGLIREARDCFVVLRQDSSQ